MKYLILVLLLVGCSQKPNKEVIELATCLCKQWHNKELTYVSTKGSLSDVLYGNGDHFYLCKDQNEGNRINTDNYYAGCSK